MKNIKFIILFFLTIQFVGCSEDFLERTPKGAPSSSNFWMTDNDAILGTNAIYSKLDAEEMYGRGYMWLINASDDMIDGRNKGVAGELKNFVSDGNVGYINDSWRDHWATIKICNDVIRNIKKMDEEGLVTASVRDFCLGQAYFVSGWMYVELAYHYGDNKMGVPILNEEDPTDYFRPREANVNVNYDYAMDLLQKAEDLLPYLTDLGSEDIGKPHKDAATAYMAKIAVYTEKWDDVITYTNKVMNSPSGRSLIDTDTPEEDFHSVFKIENNTSSEYLWSIVSNEQEGSMLPGVMLENKGWGRYNGWGYFQPVKDLDDEFETGDYRRKATLITHGDVIENFFGEDFTWYQTSNNLTGYMFSKYLDPYQNESPIGNTINTSGDYVTTDLWIPLLRYAEIVLWKAEAKLMKGENADAEINLIRNRAGLAPKSNCTMDDLKHERRCEFAGEFADRHFDLVRWGDAKEAYAKPLHGMQGTYDAENNLISTEVTEVWPGRSYNPEYHHVWPLPPNEIEKSIGTEGELVQNAGW
ncbi:RagB/SusD family nutrient uptake outer membrane protein [Prolixibacteraceae bacterium Z1-6]|uniref:RagB/SusD family nutrient uptake outer membrane protein n=1 Tax=Draconibacterium aestuarii TaxID=2998507 RepID=A0A9X3J6H1_9BACT|nr:RagB/SusD family nutrient uptake outer membrane protein [Prolixibacteraceae bacterium Z1-6]